MKKNIGPMMMLFIRFMLLAAMMPITGLNPVLRSSISVE